MKFRRRVTDDPEINLIPFIDVLLVVLIFLMLTTTYARLSALRIQLPTASAEVQPVPPARIVVAVAADGRYAIDRSLVSDDRSVNHLTELLTAAAQNRADTIVVIDADANTPHQAVINVMEAARRAGLVRVVFATKSADRAS